MKENPDAIHGRLMEAIHISGYTFERACKEFEWLLESDRWKSVSPGYRDINDFLRTIDFSEFKIAIEQRKNLAKKLSSLQASQRTTAKVLGVNEVTVARDLEKGRGATNVAKEKSENLKPLNKPESPATNVAPSLLTQSGAQVAKLAERAAVLREKKEAGQTKSVDNPVLPKEVFNLILADPPWQYDFSVSSTRQIENQYPTLNVEQIKNYTDSTGKSIQKIFAEDSILFLWVPSPKLLEGLDVMKTWGFQYVTNAIWDKESIGMGYYFRQQHELLLIGKKGNPAVPDPSCRPSSIYRSKREDHSKKPIQVYVDLEAMYPNAAKVELFSRSNRKGWMHWGSEAP